MTHFKTHTIESAPDRSRPILEGAKKAYGQVPNLLATMADAPALLEAYTAIGQIFDKTSLSPSERQVVLLAVSRFNKCEYCVAAHSVIASVQKVPDDVVDAIRDDHPIADAKLEALRRFATEIAEQRGFVSDAQVQAFLDAGYEQSHVLEVLVGIAMKTLSNYTNHIAATEVDPAFASRAWKPPQAA